jgi:hypothetical protein
MPDETALACTGLAALLPAAAALITEPDEDGTAGSGQPGTRPPWNSAAAAAVMDAHEGVRRLEASMRYAVTGHTGPKRGGSDANTMAAIKAIEALSHAVTGDDAAMAARILERWTRKIRELPAVDEAESWRRIPATCPYCGFGMLRVAARSGQVTCLRYGTCTDSDGRHPAGHMDVSALTGDPLIRWNDGLVAP